MATAEWNAHIPAQTGRGTCKWGVISALYAREIRQSAAILPPGTERDALLKKAIQADSEANLDDQSNSQPGPPFKS
jgi:hypothetical protein